MTRNSAVCAIPCQMLARRQVSRPDWTTRLAAFFAAPALWRDRRPVRRPAEELSDRLLADIGLARVRVGRESRLRPV